MKNKIVEANICMVISKGFSGLNMNALKYLLPFWISPFTGVALRCVFAAVAFWIISFFVPSEHSTGKQKVQIFLLGALGVYGYMCLYLVGLSKTTPVLNCCFILSGKSNVDESSGNPYRFGRCITLYLYATER